MKPLRQASFRILVEVPGEWHPGTMENLTKLVMTAINATEARCVDIGWACPGIGAPSDPEPRPFPAEVPRG